MAAYSVLLVDDEEDVIQAIIKKIDWESLGFYVSGYAHNGVEALELSEQAQPDVVMTDIKMPYMDGLELAKRLKKQIPTVRILIFSGFDEFEYAKEAIRLEAEEYILKPINAEELTRVFMRIRESLDKELEERRSAQMLQNYYMESLPLLQENFCASLIEGRIPAPEQQKYIRDYQLDLTGPYYAAGVIHTSQKETPEGISPVLLSVSVRKLAQERMTAEGWRLRCFSYLGNTAMILQLENPEQIVEITDEAGRFCRMAKRVLGAVVTVGIGRVCSNLAELPKSYNGAREALSCRVLYGTGQAIRIDEIEPQAAEEIQLQEDEQGLHDVFRKIRTDTPEALKKAVGEYLSRVIPAQTSIQRYHFFLMDMISELHRFSQNHRLRSEELFGDGSDLYASIQQMEPAELSSWLGNLCLKMQEEIRIGRSDTTRTFIGKAKEYIREHYADQDLTVDKICGVLGLSAAYFSTLFKKETGKTFIAYLTDVRMEQAVHLLVEKDEKTYVIANQIGYADPNYFSYVFKKYFGISPSRYKAQQK